MICGGRVAWVVSMLVVNICGVLVGVAADSDGPCKLSSESC